MRFQKRSHSLALRHRAPEPSPAGHRVTFAPFCLFLKQSQSIPPIPPQLILIQRFAFWRLLAFERFVAMPILGKMLFLNPKAFSETFNWKW